MTEVAVSLWSVPERDQAEVARRLRRDGVERFHWDHADGTMGPAGGFAPERARFLAPEGAVSEAHLMQRDPRPHISTWASFCARIAVHASQPHWREAIDLVAAAGAAPALAVTDADELRLADRGWGVLVMSVAPGHAGTAFGEGAYGLVAAAAAAGHAWIGVDGSVTAERARRLVAAGATSLVSGTDLTRAPDARAWLAAIP